MVVYPECRYMRPVFLSRNRYAKLSFYDFANDYLNKENNKHMSTLVVVGYDNPYKAEEVRLKLWKPQNKYLLDLEDAVVAVKDEKGKIKLHQAVNLTAAGAQRRLLGIANRPDLAKCLGRGGFRRAQRCGDQR